MALKELPIPNRSAEAGQGDEIMRVWMNSERNLDLTLVLSFDEPGPWGMLLSDIARHVARGYARAANMDEAQSFAAIRDAFINEANNPSGRFLPDPVRR